MIFSVELLRKLIGGYDVIVRTGVFMKSNSQYHIAIQLRLLLILLSKEKNKKHRLSQIDKPVFSDSLIFLI